MTMRAVARSPILLPESNLSIPTYIGLGVQHVLAMFGSTILGPLLMGFDPNVAVFFSGIATISFYFFVKGGVPSYLGSSFSFIAAVSAATGYSGAVGSINPHIDIALSGIMVAGFLYFIVGIIVSLRGHGWIERLFPPFVTGTIIAAIGLNLAHSAVTELAGGPFNVAFGLATLSAAILLALWLPKPLSYFSIIITIALSYLAYLVLANGMGMAQPIDFGRVSSVRWFGLPSFQLAKWDTTSVSLIAPVFVVLVAENLGHIRAIGSMCDRNLDGYIGRAFSADGAATLVAGLFGGTGVTTYAENIGVMSATRNFNSASIAIAGCIAVLLGVLPRLGHSFRLFRFPSSADSRLFCLAS